MSTSPYQRRNPNPPPRQTPPAPADFSQYLNPTAAPDSTFSFDDPLTKQFEQQGTQRINDLNTPLPTIGNSDALTAALAKLSSMMSSGGPGASGNAGLAQFQGIANDRLAQLKQPGWDASQQDLLRTNFTDPLEGQRTAAKQQVMDRLAKQGIQPSSGIALQALADVDRSFDAQRSSGDAQLSTSLMNTEEQRKQEAVSIGQLLASLGESDASRIDAANGRNSGQAFSAANALAGFGLNQEQFQFQQQQANDQRKNNAFDVSQTLGNLPAQRLQQAMAALSGLQAPTPQADNTQGLMALLIQLAGAGNTAKTTAEKGTSDLWNSIIGAVPAIGSAVKGLIPPSSPKLPGVTVPLPKFK